MEYLLKSIYVITDSFDFIFLEMPRNKNINKLAINIKMIVWYNLSMDIFSYDHKLHSCHCRFLSLLTINKIKKKALSTTGLQTSCSPVGVL